jgi:hypothetical protein
LPPSNFVRTGGGLASAAASLLLLFGHLLDLGGDPEYGTVLGGTLVLTAHVALVFALVALYAAQAEESGLLGSLGMVLSVVGTTLVSGVVLVEIAGAPERRWTPCSVRASLVRSRCWESWRS